MTDHCTCPTVPVSTDTNSTPFAPFFFFNDTATTEIYTLSLHDALPIWRASHAVERQHGGGHGAGQRDGAGGSHERAVHGHHERGGRVDLGHHHRLLQWRGPHRPPPRGTGRSPLLDPEGVREGKGGELRRRP